MPLPLEETILTDDFKAVLDLMRDRKCHVFLTGKAGTGKSTLLELFRQQSRYNLAVLAPTGISAINVRGETIHSFFHFKNSVTVDAARQQAKRLKNKGLYKNLLSIVIDEISMVRADLLDCIDVFLQEVRENKVPFGGVQMILIGDLYQLPPIVSREEQAYFRQKYGSPYFFSSKVFNHPQFQVEQFELEEIFRQKNPEFIAVLNAIREGRVSDEQLRLLNARVCSDYSKGDAGYVYLTGLNRRAEAINLSKLDSLPGDVSSYSVSYTGNSESFNSVVPELLQLKIGAQVMCLNNDAHGRWVNGSIGTVVDLDEHEVWVDLGGYVETITPHKWKLEKYAYDKEKEQLVQETVGTITQFPLKLAWAITIHKSQGKTFDKVIIDFTEGIFASGQAYVALSRCRSLDGMRLVSAITRKHIIVDRRIQNFSNQAFDSQMDLY